MKKRFSSIAATLALTFCCSTAFADDFKVPLTKCDSPVGTVATAPGVSSVWASIGQEDPTAFLMSIALDTNCFAQASSAGGSEFVLNAAPIARGSFRAGADRLPPAGSAQSDVKRLRGKRSPRMVYAHVEILDSSGRRVLSGVGNNNIHALDYSDVITDDASIAGFLSTKTSRLYSGAILNAFGGAGVTGRSRASVRALADLSAGPSSLQPPAPVPQVTKAGRAESLEEAIEGLEGNRPEFAARFATPQALRLNTYFGQLLEVQKSPDYVFFQNTPSSTMRVQEVACEVRQSDPFFAQVASIPRGQPIVVEGTFEAGGYEGSTTRISWGGYVRQEYFDTGLVDFIMATDCRIAGTWDPNDRALIGGFTGSAKPIAGLLDELKGNRLAFFRDYEGKRVAISGAVKQILQTNTDQIRVVLDDPRTDGFSGQLSCSLPSSQLGKAADLRVGQTATIIGNIQKDTSYLPIPFNLDNCELS